MIRRPTRSILCISSAASDVYMRLLYLHWPCRTDQIYRSADPCLWAMLYLRWSTFSGDPCNATTRRLFWCSVVVSFTSPVTARRDCLSIADPFYLVATWGNLGSRQGKLQQVRVWLVKRRCPLESPERGGMSTR